MPKARRSIGSQRNPASEEAILKAAHEILAADGLVGFTFEAVARKAHAGKPTVYRWWPSRAHLLLAVFERHKMPFREPDTGSLQGDILAFLATLFTCWRDTPDGNIFRSLIAEAQTSDVAAQAMADYTAARRERNARWLAKHVGEDEAPALADLLTAYALHRLTSRQLSTDDDETIRVVRYLAKGARLPAAKAQRARGPARRKGSAN